MKIFYSLFIAIYCVVTPSLAQADLNVFLKIEQINAFDRSLSCNDICTGEHSCRSPTEYEEKILTTYDSKNRANTIKFVTAYIIGGEVYDAYVMYNDANIISDISLRAFFDYSFEEYSSDLQNINSQIQKNKYHPVDCIDFSPHEIDLFSKIENIISQNRIPSQISKKCKQYTGFKLKTLSDLKNTPTATVDISLFIKEQENNIYCLMKRINIHFK